MTNRIRFKAFSKLIPRRTMKRKINKLLMIPKIELISFSRTRLKVRHIIFRLTRELKRQSFFDTTFRFLKTK